MFIKTILFLLVILLFSCQLAEIQDDWYSFRFDKVKFNNIEEVQDWVVNNIDYVSDQEAGKNEFWKYPSETLDDGEGDCEDMAILIIAIVRYQFSYKCNLVLVQIDNNKAHAIIRYKGDYYNSTSVGKYKKSTRYSQDYDYFKIPYVISTKR